MENGSNRHVEGMSLGLRAEMLDSGGGSNSGLRGNTTQSIRTNVAMEWVRCPNLKTTLFDARCSTY